MSSNGATVNYVIGRNMVAWAKANGYKKTLNELDELLVEYKASIPKTSYYDHFTTSQLLELAAKSKKKADKLEALIKSR